MRQHLSGIEGRKEREETLKQQASRECPEQFPDRKENEDFLIQGHSRVVCGTK